MNAAARRVGVDVGGTKLQGVALGADGTVLAQARRPTPRGPGSLEPLIDEIVELAQELDVQGTLGIGVPGLVGRSGVLHAAPNLDHVANFDVRGRVRDRLDVDIDVDSDATASALAEWQLGAGRGVRDMVLITLGTGIGGGIVSNGALQRGVNGFAGEFGHMLVDPNGPECPCGRQGCWERYASGRGLTWLAQRAARAGRLDELLEAADGQSSTIQGEDVLRAGRRGDADALSVIDDFTWWVAVGLSNLTNAMDPECFVLGGGLSAEFDLYQSGIERWLRELLYQADLRPVPDVRVAQWGPLAGAVGAALLPGSSSSTE